MKNEMVFRILEVSLKIQNLNKNVLRQTGMSLVQWCCLKKLLDIPGASAQELATALGVHPSTLTQSLKRLDRKHLIFIGVAPKDSRRKAISITREGLAALHHTEKHLKQVIKTPSRKSISTDAFAGLF